jgi:hypothetical protein
MKRFSALYAAALATTLVAGGAHAVVVYGTLISADPDASTIVVRTPEGGQTLYRVVQTTRIAQGDKVVELGSLAPGTQIQVIASPPTPAVPGATEVVVPVADGILIAPTSPPKAGVARPGPNPSGEPMP